MTTPRPLMNDDGLVIAAYCGDCGAHAAVRADRPGLESVEAAADLACLCPKPCSDCGAADRCPGRTVCGSCLSQKRAAQQSERRAELLAGPRFEGDAEQWCEVDGDRFFIDLDDARDEHVWAVWPCVYRPLRVTEGYVEDMVDRLAEDHAEDVADSLPVGAYQRLAGVVNEWLAKCAPGVGSYFRVMDKGVVVLSEVFPDDVDADEDEVSS